MPDMPSDLSASRRSLLRRADQALLGAALAVSLVYMAAVWLDQRRRREGLIDIETSAPREPAFQVDVNSAPWTELALLPGVGETLAKRIVASREIHGPFASHDDLRRVRGIGPKTLDGIRACLAPLSDEAAIAHR